MTYQSHHKRYNLGSNYNGHSIETLEREEAAQDWEECKKNPGHPTFIPVKNFCSNHLPVGCRGNEDILRAVELAAELTVRIRSPKSVGTGRIVTVLTGIGPSPRGSDRKWYRVRIMTAAHAVPESVDVWRTYADLYYDEENDRKNGRMKTCRGISILDTVPDVDLCVLECELHEEDIVDKIKTDLCEFAQVTNRLCSLSMDQESRETVVIVAHPHGQAKMVTVGKLKDITIFPSSFFVKGKDPWVYGDIEYDADTCPGSSGAHVLWLGLTSRHVSKGYFEYIWYTIIDQGLILTHKIFVFNLFRSLSWLLILYLFFSFDFVVSLANLEQFTKASLYTICFSCALYGITCEIYQTGRLMRYIKSSIFVFLVHESFFLVMCYHAYDIYSSNILYPQGLLYNTFTWQLPITAYVHALVHNTCDYTKEPFTHNVQSVHELYRLDTSGVLLEVCDALHGNFRKLWYPLVRPLCSLTLFLTFTFTCAPLISFSLGIVAYDIDDLDGVFILIGIVDYTIFITIFICSLILKPIKTLSFVHKQGGKDRNISFVGLWLQNY